MSTSVPFNVTSLEATRPDGFMFLEQPPVVVSSNENFRKCMLALRILLHVKRFVPVLGSDGGIEVLLNTVFCMPTSGPSQLIGRWDVRTIQNKPYTLYTLYRGQDTLLCDVYKCSELVYANIFYMINSVLYNGKLQTSKLELSIPNQSLFLYMFSATVIYLAHILYGLPDTYFFDNDCSGEVQSQLTDLYNLFKTRIGTDQSDIVRKLYLLMFYQFQVTMNTEDDAVLISDYIE